MNSTNSESGQISREIQQHRHVLPNKQKNKTKNESKESKNTWLATGLSFLELFSNVKPGVSDFTSCTQFHLKCYRKQFFLFLLVSRSACIL